MRFALADIQVPDDKRWYVQGCWIGTSYLASVFDGTASQLWWFEHPKARPRPLRALPGEVVRIAWYDDHHAVAFVMRSDSRLFASCRLRWAVSTLPGSAVLVDVHGTAETQPFDVARDGQRLLSRFPRIDDHDIVISPDGKYRVAFVEDGIRITCGDRDVGLVPAGASYEFAEWVRGAPDEAWLGGHGLILPGWDVTDLCSLASTVVFSDDERPRFVQGSHDGRWIIAELDGRLVAIDALPMCSG